MLFTACWVKSYPNKNHTDWFRLIHSRQQWLSDNWWMVPSQGTWGDLDDGNVLYFSCGDETTGATSVQFLRCGFPWVASLGHTTVLEEENRATKPASLSCTCTGRAHTVLCNNHSSPLPKPEDNVSKLCCWDSLVMSLAGQAFTTEQRSVLNSQQPSLDF